MSDELAQPEKPWWRTWDGQPERSAQLVRDPRFGPVTPRAGRWRFAAGLVLIAAFQVGAVLSGRWRLAAVTISWGLLVSFGLPAIRGVVPRRWMPPWLIPAIAFGGTALIIGVQLILKSS